MSGLQFYIIGADYIRMVNTTGSVMTIPNLPNSNEWHASHLDLRRNLG
jgi:hypothetical protein